jgi:Nucleotidyl transferase AbiEii toxin, Type IV TA system
MPALVAPRLDVLPPSQRALWMELSTVPSIFTLYGGTAIALRYGHRRSEDFDFFTHSEFDPVTLREQIPFLAGALILQSEANTLTCRVVREEPVSVSFFGVPRLGQLLEPDIVEGAGFRIASSIDLAGTKALTVQRRPEAKDYVDIDALIANGITLSMALAAGLAIYGSAFTPQITLKALSFFEDGNLPSLPGDIRCRLVRAVDAVDLDHLPNLIPIRRPGGVAQ